MLLPCFVKMSLSVWLRATGDVAVCGLRLFTDPRQEEARLRHFYIFTIRHQHIEGHTYHGGLPVHGSTSRENTSA